MGEIECTTDNHILLLVPGVQASDHQPKTLNDRKKKRVVADHEPHVEGLTRRSSSSTDVSPADMAIPPPALLPSAHPPGKPTSNKSGGKHNYFIHFSKDPNCEVCKRTKVTRAPCKRNPDDRSHRVEIAERFGDVITADHKVLHEEQLHHRYAVVHARLGHAV